MSQQKFNPNERLAFWQAYGKKCLFCTQAITLRELRLDHVVPEKVDGTEWAPVRLRLGLPDTYDLNAFENIAAACESCNSQKRDSLAPEGILAVHVGIAKTRAERVRALLEEHRFKTRDELAKFYLAQARRYDISASDLRGATSNATIGRKYPLNHLYAEQVLSLSISDIMLRRFAEL